jgi:hypothetical protein
MTNPRRHMAVIVVAANVIMFVVDRTLVPGAAMISLVASMAALAVIYGRTLLRPPIVYLAAGLAAVTLVELLDAGLLPVLRV